MWVWSEPQARSRVTRISDQGELIAQFPAPADRDGLRGLAARVGAYGQPVTGAIESKNGPRFVHDEPVAYGWAVPLADAQRVKALAPLACKTNRRSSALWSALFCSATKAATGEPSG